MTRREYLTALNQYLVTMSESEKMKILKEYDEHFREGFEAGKTESQICASLGAPYDVANDFLEGRHPKVPVYPTHSRTQTQSSSDYIGSSRRQTSSTNTGASQSRPQTAQPRPQASYAQPRQDIFSESAYHQPRQDIFSEPTYPQPQQDIFSEPTYPQPQRQTYSEPTYPQPQRQTYSEPSYSHPQRHTYSEPTYPQPQRQTYSEPSYTARNEAQYNAYSNNESAYVDYDREASEVETKPKKKKHESSYSLTGVIVVSVLGVLLVPTMGFAIYYLVRGLYELLRAFPGTGVALIAAGGSLSANSLWICLGLIFIGISFLALTGLLIMAIIEITRLFIKLFRYVLKECKKMIKEGSF